jgi:hypothetical protein
VGRERESKGGRRDRGRRDRGRRDRGRARGRKQEGQASRNRVVVLMRAVFSESSFKCELVFWYLLYKSRV